VKRSQIVFVTIVFTALVTGFLVEHADDDDPFQVQFAAPREVLLDPVELPRGSERLAGEVRSAAGRPAADVTVFLYREKPQAGSGEPVHWTLTDDEGRFALEELRPGPYKASLILPEHPPVTLTVSVPTESEVRWTLAERLPPIEVLPEIHRATLSGRVLPAVGFDPEALAGRTFEVVLVPAPGAHPLSGAVVRRVETAADGTFRVEKLVAEDYQVHVLPSWAGGGSWPILADVYHRHEPQPPADSSLPLRLRSGEIAGALIDPAGLPIEGALVKVWLAEDASKIWPPATTDERGEFSVGDLPENHYRLRLRAGNDADERDVSVLIGQRTVIPPITLDPAHR